MPASAWVECSLILVNSQHALCAFNQHICPSRVAIKSMLADVCLHRELMKKKCLSSSLDLTLGWFPALDH